MLLVRTALTVIVKNYREMLMQNFCTSIPYLDMNSFWILWYTHCVDGNHNRLLKNAHEILLNITVRFHFNFINYFCIETHPTSRYEFILDFMVRTALTVHEILLNIYPISRYEFMLDFMVKRLPWNAHEIVWNITVYFLFNFINYFCIETLSHISIWIHFGFYGTQCVGSNHKILSWNAHEILLNIVQKRAR